MSENILKNKIKILKGNIKKYRVEVILTDNIIQDILINIDFIQDKNDKTYILSLSEEKISNKFLNIFQFFLSELDAEENNMKLQSFLLNFQELFDDINKIKKSKKIDGMIIFEFSYNDAPNSYVFDGSIDDKTRYFISSEINAEYFINMKDDLFLKKDF